MAEGVCLPHGVSKRCIAAWYPTSRHVSGISTDGYFVVAVQKQMAARDAKREKKRAAEERRQRAASGGGSGAKRKGGYDSSSSDDDLDRLTRLARPKDAKKLLSRSAAKGAGSLSPLDRSPRLPTVSGLLSPKPGFDATGAYPVDESGRGEAQDGGWIETPRPFLHNVEAAKAATLGDVDIRGDGDSSGRPPRGTRGRDRGKRARGSSGRTTSLSGSGSVDLGLSDGAKQRTGNRRR